MKTTFLCLITFVFLCLSCESPILEYLPLNQDNLTLKSTSLPDATIADYEIGAYLPFWGLANYQDYSYEYLTSLNILATISKASVMENKGLIFEDDDTFPNAYDQPDLTAMLAYIRSANPSIKIFLALSDLHSNDTTRAETATLFNSTNRPTTVNWILSEYVDEFDFDGVDIDFEDSSLDLGYIGMNYPLFIKDLAIALHDGTARGRKKLCTAALGTDYNRPIITSDFINNIDLLGVMDYGSEKMDYIVANPNRDLKTIAAGWANKLPKSKLSFGLAGWSIYVNSNGTFAEGFAFNYDAQLKNRPDALWYLPYLTTDFYSAPDKPASYQQRYNGLYETRRKAEWVKDEGYRGVFLWDINKDARDTGYENYSYLKMLDHWDNNPTNYPKIVGYTQKDYIWTNNTINVGFHSLPPSTLNWVGVYNFTTGASTGYYAYLPNSSSGTHTIPSSLVNQLQSNTLYILRFYNGAGGIGVTLHGTSHPFSKI